MIVDDLFLGYLTTLFQLQMIHNIEYIVKMDINGELVRR
jgi:hypothetical protein